MQNCKPVLTEAQLKRQVQDYLEYGTNQGKWLYLRLNAGDFIEIRGETRRRIKGCPEGTSDLLVIKGRFMEDGRRFGRPRVHFIELKSARGKQSPAQGAFQKLVETQGASYFVIRSVEELEEILNCQYGSKGGM